MTKANLEGYLADGLLLRMSVINPDMNEATTEMAGFIKDLLPSLRQRDASAAHRQRLT